jgi:hypothetical protein
MQHKQQADTDVGTNQVFRSSLSLLEGVLLGVQRSDALRVQPPNQTFKQQIRRSCLRQRGFVRTCNINQRPLASVVEDCTRLPAP